MKINVLRVLHPSLFCRSLCKTVTGQPQFRKSGGGVENAGNICNSVICYKLW